MLLMVRWEIHLTSLLVLQKEPALHFLPITSSPWTMLLFMVSTDTLTLIMQLMAATSLETFWIHNLTPNTIEPAHQINYLFISGSQALSFASSFTVPFIKIYLPCCNWNLSQKYNIFFSIKLRTQHKYFTQRKFLFDGQWIFK